MGFPSPATDYAELPLSLDQLCQTQAPSVYLMRFETGSRAEYIRPGAILVIDSAKNPDNGSLVVIDKTGDFLVRRYVETSDGIRLENPDNPERGRVVDSTEFEDAETTICFGVVTHVLASIP